MDYPFEIFFPDDGVEHAPGAIRLEVAAAIACLDAGDVDGETIPEADLTPFLQTDGGGWRQPHAFANIVPSGRLKAAIAKVTAALADSIQLGQLETVHLRLNLQGVVNFKETWIRTSEFDRWARQRGLELGDLFNNYCHDEDEIFGHAIDAGDHLRGQLEGDLESTRVSDALKAYQGHFKEGSFEFDYLAKLTRDLIAARATAEKPRNSEPVLRERERTTYQNIIGGLLELLLTESQTGKRQSPFSDQAAIIEALEVRFPNASGLKNRTLQGKFAEARRSIRSTK